MTNLLFQLVEDGENALLRQSEIQSALVLRQSRTIALADLRQLNEEVEREYSRDAPQLRELGGKLWAVLNGGLPCAELDEPETVYLIEANEHLRSIPWELIFNDVFLCGRSDSPLRLVRLAGKRSVSARSLAPAQPANRPLRILFMACSPVGEKTLDFEKEEQLIFEATRKHNLTLVVEESGSLAGLRAQLEDHGPGYFDVVHLTGHADMRDGTSFFLTEDLNGRAVKATAEMIADALSDHRPQLLFLSGCKTGKPPKQGALPSLCENLLGAGVTAALGWALPVWDSSSKLAASTLYGKLSTGHRIDASVASARAKLYNDGIIDWHLLRLYSSRHALPEVVTPLRAPGRAKDRIRAAHAEFLDAGSNVAVCPRHRFVGRRRLIQAAIGTLTSEEGDPAYAEGVLLHGLVGVGKISVAARICERLRHRRRCVIVGQIDEPQFIRRLLELEPEAAPVLQSTIPLKDRLALFSKTYLERNPVIFVFDDFEKNIENQVHDPKASPPATIVLDSLLKALRTTVSESRVLVVSRVAFLIAGPAKLRRLCVDSLKGDELKKKQRSLPVLADVLRNQHSSIELISSLETLLCNNPGLLDRAEELLANLEKKEDFVEPLTAAIDAIIERTSLQANLGAQSKQFQSLVAKLSVCELPIPYDVVKEITEDSWDPSSLLHAVNIGFVEESYGESGELLFSTSPIIKRLLPKLVSDEEIARIAKLASDSLYNLWWRNQTEGRLDRGAEIVRLASLGNNEKIASEVTSVVAIRMCQNASFAEAVKLCQSVIHLAPTDVKILHPLSMAQLALGDVDRGKTNLSLVAANGVGAGLDIERAAASLSSLASVSFDEGLVNIALGQAEAAIAMLKAGNLHARAARATVTLARLLAKADRYSEALPLFEAAIDAQEKAQSHVELAMSLNLYGSALAATQQLSEATIAWKKCLVVHEKIRDVRGKAIALNNLGLHLERLGDRSAALMYLGESASLKSLYGDKEGIAATFANVAAILAKQGDRERSRQLFNSSIDAFCNLKLWRSVLQVLVEAGEAEGDARARRRYAAQATALCIRISAGWRLHTRALSMLLRELPPNSPILLLSCTQFYLQLDESSPDESESRKGLTALIEVTAQNQGISRLSFDKWWERYKTDPNLATNLLRLLMPIGHPWFFQPTKIDLTMS